MEKSPEPATFDPCTTQTLTGWLRSWRQGDRQAFGRVVAVLYPQLHRIAVRLLSSERSDHTLQPTALINELYLRLADAAVPEWRDQRHFLAMAANTLRRILIDYARAHRAQRRGGAEIKISLEQARIATACSYESLLIIDEALMQLDSADPRAARVAELRLFANLGVREIAEELGIGETTVNRDWKFARAWLAALCARTSNSPPVS